MTRLFSPLIATIFLGLVTLSLADDTPAPSSSVFRPVAVTSGNGPSVEVIPPEGTTPVEDGPGETEAPPPGLCATGTSPVPIPIPCGVQVDPKLRAIMEKYWFMATGAQNNLSGDQRTQALETLANDLFRQLKPMTNDGRIPSQPNGSNRAKIIAYTECNANDLRFMTTPRRDVQDCRAASRYSLSWFPGTEPILNLCDYGACRAKLMKRLMTTPIPLCYVKNMDLVMKIRQLFPCIEWPSPDM